MTGIWWRSSDCIHVSNLELTGRLPGMEKDEFEFREIVTKRRQSSQVLEFPL